MSFYTKIYNNICNRGMQAKSRYCKYSGLHRHHIIPQHMCGTDEESNLTYLTVREHIIAHFLLWKINNTVNDLRAMKMLGANLSVEKRRIVGLWCKENGIGFHGATQKQRREWSKRGFDKQKELNLPDSFYFWSTDDGRKKRASMGGKASLAAGNNVEFDYWKSPDGRKKRASMGGKSHTGKKTMYKPGDKNFIRVSPANFELYLNQGFIFGSPHASHNKGKKCNNPSTQRKKVSDGVTIYESMQDAAIKNNISPATITYRCKSKKSNWHYVSDT